MFTLFNVPGNKLHKLFTNIKNALLKCCLIKLSYFKNNLLWKLNPVSVALKHTHFGNIKKYMYIKLYNTVNNVSLLTFGAPLGTINPKTTPTHKETVSKVYLIFTTV